MYYYIVFQCILYFINVSLDRHVKFYILIRIYILIVFYHI